MKDIVLDKKGFLKIDLKDYDKLYSLSHTDLDGYSSQLAIEKFLKDDDIEIDYVNADYNMVDEKLKYIKKQILKDKQKKYMLIITDLGLTPSQCANLNDFLEKNNDINIHLQLLDHHETHILNEKRYSWYYVDIKKCAAMIVYEYFLKITGKEMFREVKDMVEMVQVYDLWQENSPLFKKSNFLANTVFSFLPSYPKILNKHRSCHYIYIIDKLTKKLYEKSVKEVQRELFDVCDSFYEELLDIDYNDPDFSMELKHYRYLYLLTKDYYKNFERLELEGKRYKVVYDYGPAFQNVAKYILEEINDVDFLIFVHKNKKVSLRSKESTNVAKIAEDYFGGGGHEQASGGYLKLTKNEIIHNQKDLEEYFKNNF